MKCPRCQNPTKVIDSRATDEGYKRRRHECKTCKHRFSTLEVPALEARGQIAAALEGRRLLRAMEEGLSKMYQMLETQKETKFQKPTIASKGNPK